MLKLLLIIILMSSFFSMNKEMKPEILVEENSKQETIVNNKNVKNPQITNEQENPITNMQLMDLMSGLIEKDAKIRVGSFPGETITKMVYQNVRENNVNKTTCFEGKSWTILFQKQKICKKF